ncbi:hypothetical protein TCON_2690 [Astathelohania contejeani]|uniref:Uncharacterized protein n=1 Tax=Astathelohania contejeani TaxID=164912 RepID=A0ABQ7HVF0_9MICR|nr:hypothetical protein TCON_2690 [Thelohania contejeani]
MESVVQNCEIELIDSYISQSKTNEKAILEEIKLYREEHEKNLVKRFISRYYHFIKFPCYNYEVGYPIQIYAFLDNDVEYIIKLYTLLTDIKIIEQLHRHEQIFMDYFLYYFLFFAVSNDLKFQNKFYEVLSNSVYNLLIDDSDVNNYNYIYYPAKYYFKDSVFLDILVEDINIVDQKHREQFKVLKNINFEKGSYEIMNAILETASNLSDKYRKEATIFQFVALTRDIELLRYVSHPIGTDVSIFNEISLIWCYLYQLFSKRNLFDEKDIRYKTRFTKYIIMIANRIHDTKDDEKKLLLYKTLLEMQKKNIQKDFNFEYLDSVKDKNLLLCCNDDKLESHGKNKLLN